MHTHERRLVYMHERLVDMQNIKRWNQSKSLGLP